MASANKNLRWARTYSQVSICSINDMSNVEIRQTWYDRTDYRTFRKQNKATVKTILKNRKCEKDNDDILMKHKLCERGIEHIIDDEIGTKRSKRRQAALYTVLEEQADQRYFGTFSPDFLAQLYEEVSAQDRHDAHVKGLQDEREAHTCHEALETKSIQVFRTSDHFISSAKHFTTRRRS